VEVDYNDPNLRISSHAVNKLRHRIHSICNVAVKSSPKKQVSSSWLHRTVNKMANKWQRRKV